MDALLFCNLHHTSLVGFTTEFGNSVCNTSFMEYEKAFFEEWPRISFRELAEQEVEGRLAKTLYKSFFCLLCFPERVAKSLTALINLSI